MNGPEDHAITTPHFSRTNAGRGLVIFIAAACFLVAGILWCIEPWQRPGASCLASDEVLLAVASLALLAVVARFCFGRKPARGWLWAIAICICGFVLLGGLRLMFGHLALSQFETRLDREILNSEPYREESGKSLAERLVGTLEWLRVGVPDWLTRHVENRRFGVTPTTECLIASSRWPLRRALADSLIKDGTRANFLLREWKRLFPVITGADDTLEYRHDWMKRLDHQRGDVALGNDSRQAAIICMALIILTDPPEFEPWRTKVRDMMLGWNEPFSPVAEALWMRALDTLLALDPPESWAGLTQRMLANKENLYHAMSAPVRGIAEHFGALALEFAEFERHNQTEHGFALWQCLGDSLKHWPDRFNESEAETIRNWRRDVLFRWLMDHGRGTREELSNTRGRVLLALTPQQQNQLAASAAEWARKACEEVASAVKGSDLSGSRPFNIVHLIYPYLTEQQQAELGCLLIPVMLNPELFQRRWKLDSVRFDLNWTELLWKIRPLMNEEQRCVLQGELSPLMANLSLGDFSSALLLCMDAWSDKPALTPEKWLALAWHIRRGWRIVPKGTQVESLNRFADGRLPIPQPADHAIESLVRILDSACAHGGMGFSSKLHQGLQGIDAPTASTRVVAYFSQARLSQWRSSGLLGLHPVAELLKMELCMRGLLTLDPKRMSVLKEIARNRSDSLAWEFGAWLNRTNHAANPLMEILKEPRTAAQETVRWLDDETKSWALFELIKLVEKSPPDAAVIRAIWDALRQRSLQGGNTGRARVFGMLMRLAPGLPHDEQMAMRRDFLSASYAKGFRSIAFNNGEVWGIPWNPLDYPGGGLGIPWEEDELSARLSWSSNFERLTHLNPEEPTHLHSSSAFRYLALGVFPRHERINPVNSQLERREMHPLTAPFEPTPWQKARELHLRRPDLRVR